MPLVLYLLAALLGVGMLLRRSYHRWREATERERFFLAMKEASIPVRMSPEDRLRLELLRSPWWAMWRWLPELWRRPPPSDGPYP
jgi:hypothetical protein